MGFPRRYGTVSKREWEISFLAYAPCNSFKKKNLIFRTLGHASARTPSMRCTAEAVMRIQFNQGVRRVIEYAIAVGAALLASYMILQGRW